MESVQMFVTSTANPKQAKTGTLKNYSHRRALRQQAFKLWLYLLCADIGKAPDGHIFKLTGRLTKISLPASASGRLRS